MNMRRSILIAVIVCICFGLYIVRSRRFSSSNDSCPACPTCRDVIPTPSVYTGGPCDVRPPLHGFVWEDRKDPFPSSVLTSLPLFRELSLRVHPSHTPVTIILSPRSFSHPVMGPRQRQVLFAHSSCGSGGVPPPTLVLVSEEEGCAEVAQQMGAKHRPKVEKDSKGYDRLDKLIEEGEKEAPDGGAIALMNADCFPGPHFHYHLQQLLEVVHSTSSRPYLIVGARYVWQQDAAPPYNPTMTTPQHYVDQYINKRNAVRDDALDFFVFRKGSFKGMPPFRVGRSRWDNWMMAHATRQQWTTVNGGYQNPLLYVIHPEHTREHQFQGEEALQPYVHNERLADAAGGHMPHGLISSARYELIKCTCKRKYCLKYNGNPLKNRAE